MQALLLALSLNPLSLQALPRTLHRFAQLQFFDDTSCSSAALASSVVPLDVCVRGAALLSTNNHNNTSGRFATAPWAWNASDLRPNQIAEAHGHGFYWQLFHRNDTNCTGAPSAEAFFDGRGECNASRIHSPGGVTHEVNESLSPLWRTLAAGAARSSHYTAIAPFYGGRDDRVLGFFTDVNCSIDGGWVTAVSVSSIDAALASGSCVDAESVGPVAVAPRRPFNASDSLRGPDDAMFFDSGALRVTISNPKDQTAHPFFALAAFESVANCSVANGTAGAVLAVKVKTDVHGTYGSCVGVQSSSMPSDGGDAVVVGSAHVAMPLYSDMPQRVATAVWPGVALDSTSSQVVVAPTVMIRSARLLSIGRYTVPTTAPSSAPTAPTTAPVQSPTRPPTITREQMASIVGGSLGTVAVISGMITMVSLVACSLARRQIISLEHEANR